MDIQPDAILVSADLNTAYIRVTGRGSFKGSPGMKQFGLARIDKGCRRIIVDLKECVGMDSTFMGVLAGLAMALKKHGGEGIIAINLSGKNYALLETLGLTQLIQTHGTGDISDQLSAGTDNATTKLEPPTGDKRSTTATMLDAHETLVTLAPANLPKFKDVLAYLKEDLNKLDNPVERKE
jgi:anti-anti-sigma regulatory factor